MIYKSRNGIGIRVMSITLLFFLMLTNAYEPNLEDLNFLLKKCERQLCFTKELKIWNFNEELKTEEIENFKDWAIDTTEEIEKMIKKHDTHQKMRKGFAFIIILPLIVLTFLAHFKKWFEYNVKPNANETSILNYLGSTGIIIIMVALELIFAVIFLQICGTADIKAACQELNANIFMNTIGAMNKRQAKIWEKEAEENLQKHYPRAENEKKAAREEQLMLEAENDKIVATPALSESPQPTPAMESDSTKIDQAVAELTNVYESKNSASNMTEAKIQNQSIPKIQQKDRLSKKKGDKAGSKKNSRKKECILDDIDLNLFVYPIVILFTLFAICALCNFEREEETGEITEV